MHHSESDITGLFSQAQKAEVGFRQGVIIAFNGTTKENTVNMGGTILTNIPVLTGVALIEGDIVGLLRSNTTYFILGLIIIPG
jgi:hypothetical protein